MSVSQQIRGLAALWLALGAGAALAGTIDYPASRTENVVDKIHGVEVPDPYRWLEKSDDAEVQRWTELQNALTRKQLDQFGKEREEMSKRLEELYSASSSSSPAIYERKYFYTRREGLKNHALLYVREGGMDADAKLVLDPNTFSDDGTVALDWYFPAPDGSVIAYGKSASGSERSTLYLRDVASASDTALTIPNTRACSLAWEKDGQGFFYTRYPEKGTVPDGDENYFRQVYYHKFGTDVKDDRKVFGEGRKKEEWNDVSASSDYKHQFLSNSLDWSKNDLYIRKPGTFEWQPIAVGLDARISADTLGNRIVLLTNFEAPRYRVMITDLDKPGQENWKELIPQQTGVIQDISIIGGKLVLNVMDNAYSRLLIYNADGTPHKEIDLPTLGAVNGVEGRPDKNELYYSFESFAFPPTVFRYDLDKDESKVVDKMEIDVNLDAYTTKQVWFTSKDGTKAPMFLIHKAGVQRDGHNPTVLYGYGGFNISLTPRFDRSLFVWLDRGGVYAIANLRGGGEFGKEWHLAGRLEKKQNVFDDMIAAAEKLISDKYTSPEYLACYGGSNGGLLVGAMITQRPDLFRAAVSAVPLLDMLRYHQLSIARLWIPEYGSAEDANQFKTLLAYSPYHHVKTGARYPATLFVTAESDSRVDPMHARKMAAEMQAAQSDHTRPILLWVETKAGHGAGKPLKKQLESKLDLWTFFLWQLGVIGPKS